MGTKCYRGVQARKKKGMFVPSMKDLQVPTIDKASYLSSKSSNQAPSFNQNATVAQNNISGGLFGTGNPSVAPPSNNNIGGGLFSQVNTNSSPPVQEKTLFNSAGSSSLFGNNSNIQMNQQRPMMKKNMKSKRPQFRSQQQQQQIPLFQQQQQQQQIPLFQQQQQQS